jgi:hypothetical protein
MRGKLIFPFWCELARLDTVATAADPDGAGVYSAGYDPDFKEPVKLSQGEGPGESHREEKSLVKIPAQIEPQTLDRLQMFASGNVPDARMAVVMHFRYLEQNGLVDTTTGEPLIRIGDRLNAIYDKAGTLVQTIRPELYVTEVRPIGYGLGHARNLLLVVFDDRETGVPQG